MVPRKANFKLGNSYGRSALQVISYLYSHRVSQGYSKLDPDKDALKQIANEDYEPRVKQGDYMEQNEQDRVTKIFGNL